MTREPVRQIRQRLVRAFGEGLHADFVDLITRHIEEQYAILENQNDTTDMLRTQGGIRALRQILADITPRSEN